MVYMIFEISFSIFNFFLFFSSIFTFSKQSFLGIFGFLAKNTRKLQDFAQKCLPQPTVKKLWRHTEIGILFTLYTEK